MRVGASEPGGAALLARVAAHGGRVEGLVVRASGGERGVYATRPFAAGEVVLSVPAGLLVGTDALAETPRGRAMGARFGADAHPVLLAAWLVDALARRDGPVGDYVATLPTTLAHLPVHYGEAERAALAGTAFADRVDARRARLDAEHAWLAETGDAPSAEAWRRARSLVTSRSFACGAGEALVPLGDLVNHAPDPGTRWTCDPRDGFVLRATRALPVGELFVSYGPKSNARYLLAYGFTLADSPIVDMELALGELGAFRLALDPDTPEVERLLFAMGGGGSGRARLRRARALLAEVCGARLARLPDDTPEERGDPRLRDALRVRADERAILAFWAA